MKYRIEAVCEKNHRTMNTTFDESFTKEWVDEYAKMLDGTSSFYVHSPIGTDSPVGKCTICKTQIKCIVSEAE